MQLCTYVLVLRCPCVPSSMMSSLMLYRHRSLHISLQYLILGFRVVPYAAHEPTTWVQSRLFSCIAFGNYFFQPNDTNSICKA